MTVPATEPTGASGSTPRQKTVDAINALWNQALRSLPGEDLAGDDTSFEVAIAIASGLLFIGDQLAGLREDIHTEVRWRTEQDLPRGSE